jgi:hypothetical protein
MEPFKVLRIPLIQVIGGLTIQGFGWTTAHKG